MVKKSLVVVLVFGALLVLSSWLQAQEKESKPGAEGVAVTIYNSNLGIVKEKREIELAKGISMYKFIDVASRIDPTSVLFRSITNPKGVRVLEQNYEYDLLSTDKLFNKYIDKDITILTKDGKEYKGVLMSYDGNQVILKGEGNELYMIERKDNIRDIKFSKLPEGLLTRPTLIWKIDSEEAGKNLVELTYMTSGMNWHVEYVTLIDKEDKLIDVNGWVSLENTSGAGYKDAKVKLIAGDVYRAPAPQELRRFTPQLAKGKTHGDWGEVEERTFFEYHLYELPVAVTVKEREVKQVELLDVKGVPVEKQYVFDSLPAYSGSEENTTKAKTYFRFKNSKENNLGMPLPKGKVRVYKVDEKDGSKEFVGEDTIDHTPKDEKVKVYLGDAFDIVASKKTTGAFSRNNYSRNSYEISVRNRKEDKDIKVTVVERVGQNWTISENSHGYDKKDAYTVEFNVDVPKGGETVIKYTIEYNW